MAEYGMVVKNDNSTIIIDSQFKNFKYYEITMWYKKVKNIIKRFI